ncbi:MAG TPA: DUF4097 family beta strand repeat-containing protein [Clostridia bacterium]|nr:DUF4097 family beta strand repeat-containing protein [Clostridia bacterium]
MILTLLSVAAGLRFLGFVLIAAGGFQSVTSTRFNFAYFDRGKRLDSAVTEKETVSPSKCGQIELDLVNADLTVSSTDGSDITLTYQRFYEKEWSYSLQGRTMELKYGQKHGWLSSLTNWVDNSGWGDSSRRTVVLSIPRNAKAAYKIINVNGSVHISGISADSLNMNGVNTQAEISDVVSAGDIRLNSVNGGITINRAKMPALRFSGMVNADCTVNQSNADIKAGSFVNSTLNVTTANTDDYYIVYKTVGGVVNVQDGHYSGKGSIGAKDRAHRIDFEGVNSNLSVK